MMNYIVCSECFLDEGLKLTISKYGVENKLACSNCGKSNGKKISEELLDEICWEYFVNGSAYETEFGGSSLLMFNKYQKTSVKFSENLTSDIEIIEKKLGIGFFYYAPRLFKLGYIEQLEKLRSQNINQEIEVLDEIINKFPIKNINEQTYFYRLRKNPSSPYDHSEYDSPPIEFCGNGRLDSNDFDILYGSENIEICLHECKVTLIDELYLGKLVPTKNLKILDLSADIVEEGITEFESLSLSIHFLFRAGNHSYEICRKIAKYALSKGFDGLIYPSYFSKVKSDLIPNIALFNYPLKEGKIKVENINRILIDKVNYEFTFGPQILDE